MSDSPLLTPEAAAEVSAALADLVVNDPHDVEFVPLLGTIGSPQAVGNYLGRAFLAAHDPDALARGYFAARPGLTSVEDAFRWLGLGGDDA